MEDSPNEAYEVVQAKGDGPPSTWWTVLCNGIPVRHFGPDRKETAERYATDPEYRASLKTNKLWEAGPLRPAGSADLYGVPKAEE
jgi:hypothetical protein